MSAGFASYITQSELPDENATSGNPTVTHPFQEATSVDLSSGIEANTIISLFKNDNAKDEMFFTLGKDKTATIQYIENGKAIWQNTSYAYSMSGKTITCNLPASGGGLDVGQISSPTQVILVVDSTTVTAHVSATMNQDKVRYLN